MLKKQYCDVLAGVDNIELYRNLFLGIRFVAKTNARLIPMWSVMLV
jgi:hypothetical protein